MCGATVGSRTAELPLGEEDDEHADPSAANVFVTRESLLRRLWDVLRPGDVLLGDRLMSGWAGMHLLKERVLISIETENALSIENGTHRE